ncbi:DUF305 domain-containing protein [Motilibacter aurantiacus]|uniref:DUF305 domain-containing protein n=1 Tax=Motilibacter aurantiacus TaxID=2714955 RepID=UPI0014081A01|nr:DUF305 domain-containing protein [Motilibacter aurantiacus]NHC44922.1 DUF305 domain-containing protein [Motilibacter aurantiacus]
MRASGLLALVAAVAAALIGTTALRGGPGRDVSAAQPVAASAGPAAAQPVVRPKPPNAADVVFAQMMVPHHQQAVRMSRLLLAKDGVHDRARAIAEYIARDQAREASDMRAWLTAWGKPLAPGPGPAHGAHGSRWSRDLAAMPGMLTPAQLRRLDGAVGAPATELFLRQMIEHHLGALDMARQVVAEGDNVYTRKIAKHILAEQAGENAAMARLIDEL